MATLSASITRMANATPYDAKDIVAALVASPQPLTFAGASGELSGQGRIKAVRVVTDLITCITQFRLHLFNAAPAGIADLAQCTAPLFTDRAKWIASISLAALATSGGTGVSAAYVQSLALDIPFSCANGDNAIYGLLETIDGFTPASGQIIAIYLEVAPQR